MKFYPIPRWILFNSLVVVVLSYSSGKNQFSPPNQIINNDYNFPVPEYLGRNLVIEEGDRVLTSGGAANPYERSLNALSLPIGTLFGDRTRRTRSEVQDGLKYVLQTRNPWTFALHGTGNSGISAVLDNLIETGDKVLVGVCGLWGEVAANAAERFGANVTRLVKSPGSGLTFSEIEAGVREHRPKILYLVHGESSTGVLQRIDGIGNLCRRFGCLSVVDVVATVGQIPIRMDARKIDVVLFNSQKGCGGIVGLAPVSFSPRAVSIIQSRKTLPRLHQFQITSQAKVWFANNTVASHAAFIHSSSHPLLYMLREGLGHLVQDGIANVWERHEIAHKFFHDNAERLGLEFFVPREEERLPGTYTFKVPEGKDIYKIEEHVLDKYSVDISPGMGPTLGKVIRVGLFGNNAGIHVAQKVLDALRDALESHQTDA